MTSYTVYLLRDGDDKVYVGVTSQPIKRRWNNGNGYRFVPELWLKIKSQGWGSIHKEVVDTDLDKSAASKLEQELIKRFDSTNPAKGYNRELGGLGNEKILSVGSRDKIRQSLTGEHNPNFGKHLSTDHRSKIANANRGLKRSCETCTNIGKVKEKPVAQYSREGLLIAVYESCKKASLATGTQVSHISKVCKHQRVTAGGYKWCYY